MMKMRYLLLLTVSLLSTTWSHAGNGPSQYERFGQKLALALFLLQQQPGTETLKEKPHWGFRMGEAGELGYTLTDAEQNSMEVYLQRSSQRIFLVEFYESGTTQKELHGYLTETEKYEWVGSEHSCDFLNNRMLALTLCPTEKGVRVNVNLMLH